MSLPSRSLSSHIRAQSTAGSSAPSPALQARIEEKKTELDHLKQLRELSASVANQMEALEGKLATLSSGTEAIANVMGNWHNVLRAINMASSKLTNPVSSDATDANGGDDSTIKSDIALPHTLVRIPTEHAPALQAQADMAETEGDEDTH